MTQCKGAVYVKEIWESTLSGQFQSYKGKPLNKEDIAKPCGLVAKAFFRDSFTIQSDLKSIFINQTNISNYWDRDVSFKNSKDAFETQWLDYNDGFFIIKSILLYGCKWKY